MKSIRKILVNILGLKGYLQLVSYLFIRMISFGMKKEKYHDIYFIKRIIKQGDSVIDIGANLGYYSFFMAQSIGQNGKLVAIEPIPLFADIWKKNMHKYKKFEIELFNCALGNEAQKSVKMSIPIVDGVVRHGLTKIVKESNTNNSFISYDVPMKVGDKLIEATQLEQVNYIKCDVEHFEQYVIPSLNATIDKHKPVLQIELSGPDNRKNVVDFLINKDYGIYILKDHLLKAIQKKDTFTAKQDFYFIHPDKIIDYKSIISNQTGV